MLRKENKLALVVAMAALGIFFFPEIVYAAETANDDTGDIFTTLGNRAQSIGFGLKRVGYIIAGLGLIFVTFMAIFNKISWKTLFYIFLSCFTLTLMTGVINMMSSKTLTYEHYSLSSGSAENLTGEVIKDVEGAKSTEGTDKVQASKSGS